MVENIDEITAAEKNKMNVVLCDSSSFKFHRHGGGLKKGFNQKVEVYQD